MTPIGIGLIGTSFMGKAHTLGYRQASVVGAHLIGEPTFVAVCGSSQEKTRKANEALGYEKVLGSWQDVVDDDRVSLVDICCPNNLHEEIVVYAASRGKSVFCEKPLAPTLAAARSAWLATKYASVTNMCGFNYRFFPALRLAHKLVNSGELGNIVSFRSRFLLSSALDLPRTTTWRDYASSAGSGALGDVGSHHIDLCRFICGLEIENVYGVTRTIKQPEDGAARVDTDDLAVFIARLSNGAVATFEASRISAGHGVTSDIEIDGDKKSLRFSLQKLNFLEILEGVAGKRTINTARHGYDLAEFWFPGVHPLSWGDSFTHAAIHLLTTITRQGSIAPLGATLEDGYRCAAVVDAVVRSSQTGHPVKIHDRD